MSKNNGTRAARNFDIFLKHICLYVMYSEAIKIMGRAMIPAFILVKGKRHKKKREMYISLTFFS